MLPEKVTFRPAEAADYWQVTRTTVYNWVRRGRLEAVRVNGRLRIPREAILALSERSRSRRT